MVIAKVSIILSLYRGERFLECYLHNIREQTIVDQIELIVVHNDPTDAERQILDRFSKTLSIIRCEAQRESLYSSWNRAISQSKAQYLVCWNVDDLRTADSLEKMVRTLDKNAHIGWTYGDFMVSSTFGAKSGRVVYTPEWSKDEATSGAIGGPFFMWRRSLVTTVGWFDEQFASGGDFDYTVRLSLQCVGAKTPGLLGYFLNERTGLSTVGDLQPVERTAIQLRYGIYQTLDWTYVHRSLAFRIRSILQPNGNWLPVEDLVPMYGQLIDSRRLSAWLIPYHTIKANIYQALANIFVRR